MSTTSIMFSGNSRFALDFQAIIDRQVALASLPLKQLEDVKTALSDQSTALSSLDSKFTALETAISGLESALGLGSYSYSTSDTGVSATLSAGIAEGSYLIKVTSLGAYTNAMSNNGLLAVSNPVLSNISAATTFTLTVNGVNYTVEPAAGTLSALAAAINALSGAHVQASIVNLGSSVAPDYRLAVRSTLLGANTVQLNDGAEDLLTAQVTGSKASYKINGQAAAVESDSRAITLAPGLTVNLLKESEGGDPATLTISRSTAGVSSALGSFATAYNAVVDELAQHRGENAGALASQSIVATAAGALQDIGYYGSGAGAIQSLTDLGLTFDTEGRLSFDSATFASATSGQFTALAAFLDSFLESALDTVDSLEDPISGLVKTSLDSVEEQITDQDTAIAEAQVRVDLLRQRLESQMAAADALIAALEQQVTFIGGLFESMRIAGELYG